MDIALNKVKVNSHSACHKDFESVVIGTLITKAHQLKLNYKTQQPVRLSDGKLYLLDMYFPDINLAVECDEAQHANPTNAKEDLYRQDQVVQVLDSDFMRVNAHDTAVQFFEDIEKITFEMQNRKSKMNIKDYDYSLELGLVDYVFKKIVADELSHKLGAKESKAKTPYADCITLLSDQYPVEGMWIVCYPTTLKVALQYDPKYDQIVKDNLYKFEAIDGVEEAGYAKTPYILRLTVDNKYFTTCLDKTIEQAEQIAIDAKKLFLEII